MNDWVNYLAPIAQYAVSGIIYFAASYITLHFKVKQLMKQMNGIGAKVDGLDKKLSSTNESLAHTQGYIEAKTGKSYMKKTRTGNA